jgi:hypothetical protein
MIMNERRIRQIVKEEARRLVEAWVDDETPPGTGLGGEARMFLDANPDWREELEDTIIGRGLDPDELSDEEYRSYLSVMLKNFGLSHGQSWAKKRARRHEIAKELIDNS